MEESPQPVAGEQSSFNSIRFLEWTPVYPNRSCKRAHLEHQSLKIGIRRVGVPPAFFECGMHGVTVVAALTGDIRL